VAIDQAVNLQRRCGKKVALWWRIQEWRQAQARQNLSPALMTPVCTSTMSNEPLEPEPELRH
jgi:hypothetical protein